MKRWSSKWALNKYASKNNNKIRNLVWYLNSTRCPNGQSFNFQETKSDNKETPKFNVTLGIMPDYLYDGIGLKIDGVSKGKTAFKFGLLENDVIIKMGASEILNIVDYMHALSKFEKGDSTRVEVKRKNEKINIPIIFQ